MRSVLLSLLFFCSTVTSTFALSATDLPGSFDIKEQQCLKGGCFDLMAHGQKIGALRPTPDTTGTFDFFDEHNDRQVTLKLTRATWGIWEFDIYDKNQGLVARMWTKNKLQSGLKQRFDITSVDRRIILASGISNAFGTLHNVYAGRFSDITVQLSRPLFTWSRDSTVTIINRPLLLSTLDPNVLVAVLAVYSFYNVTVKVDPTPKVKVELPTKLQQVADAMASNEPGLIVTAEQMKAAADLLNQKYRETYDDANLSEEEKIKQFVYFACDLIQAHTLQPREEQAVLQFLKTRLI